MNMLSSFYDISKDSRDIFSGLYISSNKEICDRWMNKFPTVFVSFKDIDGLSFESAYGTIRNKLKDCFHQYEFLLESKNINNEDKKVFQKINEDSADNFDIKDRLTILLRMLYAYYERKVILLIDEYDVPMAKASEKGYYPEMLDMMKGILSVLKDNSTLDFQLSRGV